MELEAAENSRKKFRYEATCPICLSFFSSPVILDCGHNFCQRCILRCWMEPGKKPTCPQCRKTVSRKLKPNRSLSNVVEILGEWDGSVENEIQKRCQKHQQHATLFCKEDWAILCVECEKSQDHNTHTLVSVEVAAGEYKEQISQCLKTLEAKKNNILAYKKNLECKTLYLSSLINGEKKKVAAQFTELRQFADIQEKVLQGHMEEVEKELTRKKEELCARISRELASLDMFIMGMEEKSQLTTSELLKDDLSLLQRYKARQMSETSKAYPDELKWKIWDFCDITPYLAACVKQYRDSLESELPLQKAKVTLDPDTAHPHLVISENLRCVRYGEKHQELLNNPERFDKLTAVVGREVFSTGRHTWEVIVGTEGNWAVGIARKSVKRKRKVRMSCGNDIWVFGKWEGHYRSTGRYCVYIDPSKEPRKVQITLNCTGQRVAFFNSEHTGSITAFTFTSSPGEGFVPFFWVGEKACLELVS